MLSRELIMVAESENRTVRKLTAAENGSISNSAKPQNPTADE